MLWKRYFIGLRGLGGRFFRPVDWAVVFGLWAIGLVVLAYPVGLLARLRRLLGFWRLGRGGQAGRCLVRRRVF